MKVWNSPGLAATMALGVCLSGCVIPESQHPSLWTSLGVPQAWNAAGGHVLNRRGGRPERELKPPVKRLADPENLKSEVPAIKKAAEIKQAEDAKQQKIKAVRYLAESAGCGCYDEEGEVTDALVAALDDCTEEVRFATVKALLARSQQLKKDGPCSRCNGSCCNQKLIDKLSKLVYDLDDTGCRIEPSERVRNTARAALQICCPARCQNNYPQQAQPSPTPEPAPSDDPINLEGVSEESSPMEPDMMPEGDSGEPSAEDTGERSVYSEDLIPTISMGDDSGFSAVSYHSLEPMNHSNDFEASQRTTTTVVSRSAELTVNGSVLEIAAEHNVALVEFRQSAELPIGTRLQLKRRQQLGRIDYLGEVEVVESETGKSVVKPVPPLSIKRIGVGDAIMLTQ